jgi:excisionase family DNA binding protein
MSDTVKPLFVRLPSAESDRLDAIALATGKSKRQLVSEAVREHLGDDGLTLGRIALGEETREVLTLPEAAKFLQLSDLQVEAAARAEELPCRRIGTEWRFSRSALLAWLGS